MFRHNPHKTPTTQHIMIKHNPTLPVFRLLFALLACVGLLTVSHAQTTFDWTGSESTIWSTADNWNPSAEAPPGTSDIARFNASVLNNPTLGSATTIGRIEFVTGAGSYTISGEPLTLGATTGYSVSNSSGLLQTFSSAVTFSTATNANLYVGSGSTTTFSSTISRAGGANGTLTVEGGGTVNFTGNFSAFTLYQNLSVSAGTIVNYNTTTNYGFNNYIANGGRINLARTTGTGGIALRLSGTGGEIYITEATTITTGTLNFRGDGTSGKTLTFGADIAGTGNATYSGTVNFNNSGNLTNQTYRLHASANNTLILSGTLVDANTSTSGTKVEITGPGVVRYSGANASTSVTPTVISSVSTLELAKTAGVNAIAGGPVTVEGILRLAANNQIADATPLTLSGGTFEIGAFTDSLGALSVAASGGALDFDDKAGSITFASLASIAGTLTIQGWVEGSSSIFFTDGSGWNPTTLAQVNFVGYGAAQFNEITGELYAIPEPSTLALFALAAGAGIYFRRRSVTHKA